ncbi:hypothetical protein NECAME_14592, partial [Necator americanus]
SVCSFRQYLSTVEDYCPPTTFFRRPTTAEVFAETNTDLQRLLTVLSGNAGNYNYIRERLVQHWSSWTEALRKTLGRYPNSMSNRKKLNILIHMGLLTEKNLHIGEKSGSGGPLGELLQWSDLIACLFLLGHNLYISSDKMTLLRCRIRLVDSFGTHVEFNYRSYFNAHQSEFAMEGPAPLEAIAHGAVFINPKFHPPKSRLNAVFLREKPTLREFTSQSPYMERLGKPYVYTIDINDSAALSDAITTALKEKPKPFVPEEFTPEGMLIRVNMLVVRDLCSKKSVWPPATSLQPVLGAPEVSCEKGCESAGLVCEPSFFPLVNSASVLERLVGCTEDRLENSTAPFAPYGCSLQSSSLMFSCASRPPSGSAIKRICPCRDYLPGQVALCSECVH